ncbi:unnamed protein product [Camellia sinensis]
MPNVANLPNVGDRLYDESLYEAAKLKKMRRRKWLHNRLTDELNKVDEKLKATEALLESKNLEIKKINDEKKAALAAQFAAEATLRRVHAAQKDDEMPPIEAIITPLEAKLKLARLEKAIGNTLIDNVGSTYYHNDSALPTTTVALTDNCLKGMTICQILGFNVKGWCGRLVFSPSQCLIFPAPKPFFCYVDTFDVEAANIAMPSAGSSRQQRNQKVWLLPPFTYDYKSEKYSSPKDYYAGIRAEWAFRVTEQEGLFNDLRNFGAPVPHRRSLTMARRNVSDYEKAVSRIKKENNRMLMRRCRHFMLQLATEMAEASNRDLTVIERNNVLNNEKYLSGYYMSDEE